MPVCQSTTEIFLAIFMVLVLCGCKDDAKAPDYDNFRSEMTLQTVENIRHGKTDDALETLDKLQTAHPSDPFPVAARRTEQIRALVENANTLLRQARVNDLADELQKIEDNGNASPEILAFRAAPPAIEALSQYCARMPWERSTDIAEGFEILRPHLNILISSKSFNDFLKTQQSKYETLKQTELKADIRNLLGRIDKAFISADAKALQGAINALRQKYPQNPFFSCQSIKTAADTASLSAKLKEETGGPEALEIAAAIQWDELPPAARRGMTEIIGTAPLTYSGAWIAAMTGGRAATIAFLTRLREKHPLVTPNHKIIASLMKLNASEQVKNNVSNRLPCPGGPEIIDQILSISLPKATNKQQKENK